LDGDFLLDVSVLCKKVLIVHLLFGLLYLVLGSPVYPVDVLYYVSGFVLMGFLVLFVNLEDVVDAE